MRKQQIITTVTCDHCGQPAVTTFQLAIVEAEKTRLNALRPIDVCEQHAGPLREAVNIFEKLHRPADLNRTGQVRCPLCPSILQRTGVNAHLRSIHKRPLIVQPKQCPECGRVIETSHPMQMHRRRAHGYDLMEEMLTAASPEASPIVEPATAPTRRKADAT